MTITATSQILSSPHTQILLIEEMRRWGGSTADSILNPECKIFNLPNTEGFISYKDEDGCAIILGDPVCPPENIPKLCQAFHALCKKEKKNVVYVVASESFAKWAEKNGYGATIEFGEELYMDPFADPRKNTGENGCLVRKKIKHAEKEGTSVHEYTASDKKTELELEQIALDWVNARKGPQIYISNIDLFSHRHGKRWLYAKHNDKIVGLLVLNQIQACKGWHLNNLMLSNNAPNGTSELLIVSALETLANEDCHYINFGPIPGESIGSMTGLNSFTTAIIPKAYQAAKWFFKLGDRKKFWEKFRPESAPSYIIFVEPQIRISDIKGLFRSLNVKI